MNIVKIISAVVGVLGALYCAANVVQYMYMAAEIFKAQGNGMGLLGIAFLWAGALLGWFCFPDMLCPWRKK